ncbi:MAG: ADP-ribosylglycohydrolase family protein [Streptosporangiales bacterium]
MAPGTLVARAVGCLVGAAVGDALGGATEGWTPEQIKDRWGGWVTGIVPPYYENWRTARPIAPYHKGDGHITDDTLLTHLLVDVYEEKRDHLDAYDMADLLVPRLMERPVWIPELEDEALPLQRVFLAEKFMALRVHWAHADPREAGIGNAVNCGAAMYMAPVGIVNAADPDRAYAEAIDMTGAHQHSYGREAAGVLAAAVAAAMSPVATASSVVETALRLAKDGTRAAIEATCTAAARYGDWAEAIESGALRDAVRPYDTVADTYRDQGLGARRPSRVHSIEELPVALGMFALADGDWETTVLGGVNYGRDADSIATMGGALAGALAGRKAVPDDLARSVQAASRVDLTAPAERLAEVTAAIRANDRTHRRAVEDDFDLLTAPRT